MLINNSTIQNTKKYLPMLKQFVERDFKIKYRRSVLGVLWSVLSPLGTMIILTLVFSSIFKQAIENFPVYLMCGQLVFNFFNEASSSAMNSIINNGHLIQKVYIPKYLLPVSSVCTALVNLLTTLIALLLVILITRTPITYTVFFAIIPVAFTWLFALGVGLILSVIATSYRDMQHLYGIIITAWMYLTPIFYPLSMLPAKAQFIVKLNPLTQFVEMMRRAILYNSLPTIKSLLYCSFVTLVTLLIGMILFKKNQDEFILKL